MKKHPAFHRTELLIGEAALKKLAETRAILFGVGGVGSWCAEALIRAATEPGWVRQTINIGWA